jgi:uncharacterized protein YcfL
MMKVIMTLIAASFILVSCGPAKDIATNDTLDSGKTLDASVDSGTKDASVDSGTDASVDASVDAGSEKYSDMNFPYADCSW